MAPPHSTRVLPFDDAAIAEAARLILAGECVAMPTETVYGLAADATNAAAVAHIYAAKGRPTFNPLIVHVRDLAAAKAIGAFNAEARALAEAHWPGPLTLVVPLRHRRADRQHRHRRPRHDRAPGPRAPRDAGAARRRRQAARRPFGQRQRPDQPDAGVAMSSPRSTGASR